ncbi:MAG: hypothetical protein JWN04_2117, partial [Myxococcaceae bacterium]|nr:hypothetical protein [Myxococcaceae bacterium]
LRKLESLALVSRKLASSSQRGERRSSRAGSGIAFATHRAYAPGDDFRFVDWKAFARSEQLYVKQYEQERALAVHLLLDCSSSMAHDEGAKFRYAKQLAAALGYIALVNLDSVSVQPYAGLPRARLAPLRGRNRALILLHFLAALTAHGTTDLPAAAKSVAAHAASGGLSFVLSDGFDGASLLEGVDRLRIAALAPVVLLLTDRRDAEPTLRGELSLVDSESGETRTLRIDERALTRYRAAYRLRLDQLRAALAQRRVPAVELGVEVPLERAVLGLLRRGGIVA